MLTVADLTPTLTLSPTLTLTKQVLNVAEGCAESADVLQQLYRNRLQLYELHGTPQELVRTARARAARLAALAVTPSTPPPPVNACVAAPSALGWLPNEAFDAAVSFGGL